MPTPRRPTTPRTPAADPGDTGTIDVSRFTARWRPLAGIIAQIERTSGLVVGQPVEVASRLDRLLGHRLSELAIDASGYADRCAQDPMERLRLLDLLQRRSSGWFIDAHHFSDLERRVVPLIAARFLRTSKPVVRIWCAATGSGEEAYSIAASLHRALPDRDRWDSAILATDPSIGALQEAQIGRYDAAAVACIPEPQRSLTVSPAQHARARRSVREELRRTVHFAWLDGSGDWEFVLGPFDAVFCRGLLDRLGASARARVIDRFAAVLRPGSTLYVRPDEDYPEIAARFSKELAAGIWRR